MRIGILKGVNKMKVIQYTCPCCHYTGEKEEAEEKCPQHIIDITCSYCGSFFAQRLQQ